MTNKWNKTCLIHIPRFNVQTRIYVISNIAFKEWRWVLIINELGVCDFYDCLGT